MGGQAWEGRSRMDLIEIRSGNQYSKEVAYGRGWGESYRVGRGREGSSERRKKTSRHGCIREAGKAGDALLQMPGFEGRNEGKGIRDQKDLKKERHGEKPYASYAGAEERHGRQTPALLFKSGKKEERRGKSRTARKRISKTTRCEA